MEISVENLSGDIGITGVNWDRNDFQHSVVLIAAAGLQLCVCFVGYRGKKNRMYQQETTIRQWVIQCESFYNQVALFFARVLMLYISDFLYSAWNNFCDWSNISLLSSLEINYTSLIAFIWVKIQANQRPKVNTVVFLSYCSCGVYSLPSVPRKKRGVKGGGGGGGPAHFCDLIFTLVSLSATFLRGSWRNP